MLGAVGEAVSVNVPGSSRRDAEFSLALPVRKRMGYLDTCLKRTVCHPCKGGVWLLPFLLNYELDSRLRANDVFPLAETSVQAGK